MTRFPPLAESSGHSAFLRSKVLRGKIRCSPRRYRSSEWVGRSSYPCRFRRPSKGQEERAEPLQRSVSSAAGFVAPGDSAFESTPTALSRRHAFSEHAQRTPSISTGMLREHFVAPGELFLRRSPQETSKNASGKRRGKRKATPLPSVLHFACVQVCEALSHDQPAM